MRDWPLLAALFFLLLIGVCVVFQKTNHQYGSENQYSERLQRR